VRLFWLSLRLRADMESAFARVTDKLSVIVGWFGFSGLPCAKGAVSFAD